MQVEQFLDKEAEVSGDDDEDDEWSNTSYVDDNIDSFIDDEATKPSDITNYLRSLKYVILTKFFRWDNFLILFRFRPCCPGVRETF